MLLLPAALRILLAAEPIDLRRGIDGLMALVQGGWKEDVYGGALFVFVSRRRDRVKILTWDNCVHESMTAKNDIFILVVANSRQAVIFFKKVL